MTTVNGKPYWNWTCHACGKEDLRNHQSTCTECGARIRCETAGGHWYKDNAMFCSSGCGRHQNGQVDLSKRRADY